MTMTMTMIAGTSSRSTFLRGREQRKAIIHHPSSIIHHHIESYYFLFASSVGGQSMRQFYHQIVILQYHKTQNRTNSCFVRTVWSNPLTSKLARSGEQLLHQKFSTYVWIDLHYCYSLTRSVVVVRVRLVWCYIHCPFFCSIKCTWSVQAFIPKTSSCPHLLLLPW